MQNLDFARLYYWAMGAVAVILFGSCAAGNDNNQALTSNAERCPLPAFVDSEKFDVENHIFEVNEFGLVIDRSKDTDDGNDDIGDGSEEAVNNDDASDDVFYRIINTMGEYGTQFNGRPKLNKLLLYFNGGLSDPEHVREQAERQVPCMLSDEFFPGFMI